MLTYVHTEQKPLVHKEKDQHMASDDSITVRITIDLPNHLVEWLFDQAFKQRVNISVVVSNLVQAAKEDEELSALAKIQAVRQEETDAATTLRESLAAQAHTIENLKGQLEELAAAVKRVRKHAGQAYSRAYDLKEELRNELHPANKWDEWGNVEGRRDRLSELESRVDSLDGGETLEGEGE